MLSFFWVLGLFMIVIFCYYLFVGGSIIIYSLINDTGEKANSSQWSEYIFHPFVTYPLMIIGVVLYMITDDNGWKETRSAWREMFK